MASANRTPSASGVPRATRPTSATSLTPGSATSGAIYCAHRFHHQLDKLKTLRLSHNKLTRFVVTVLDNEEELQSSGEDTQSSSLGMVQ